jgi:hypothetical protein
LCHTDDVSPDEPSDDAMAATRAPYRAKISILLCYLQWS